MKRWLFVLGLLSGACASDPSGGMPGVTVVTGEWGGVDARMDATNAGATFQFKCGASGVLSTPLLLDEQGRFDQAGTYDPVVVAGGPRPATFQGTLQGGSMTLSVSLQQTVIGPYQLAKDQQPRFDVCNY